VLSLNDYSSLVANDLKTGQNECNFPGKNFLLANDYRVVMIAYSFREVRPAIDRGFNEVDEVDRPQPGGAGCGCSSQPA
jgi:hypothetical protein